MRYRFKKWVGILVVLAMPCVAQVPLIPLDVLTGPLATHQHPDADQINGFISNQANYTGSFTPTGLTRADYLPVIDSIARAMMALQNSAGRVIDPTPGLNREHQYATPALAHAISVLFKSGYTPVTDTALLNSGTRALTAAIASMKANTVPDSHGDFFMILIMLAFENFKGTVDAGMQAGWRTNIGTIPIGSVYKNSAPNWTGINTAGEFLRYKEGLTTIAYVKSKLAFQISRLGKDGTYQDVTTAIDTAVLPVANKDGQSLAYDNVARGVLGVIASGGYSDTLAPELNRALWKGAWTGLLSQSPSGEVPTGMRSSHHLWNEGYAAVNYEIWAKAYAKAGKPEIAGAFTRAAHLSLAANKLWLRPAGTAFGGSGYVTKARYAPASKWGYMSYSGLTNYNGWAASSLALAWQIADTVIMERPAPSDIGGYVLTVLPGFKKIFGSAGGTYAEYDVRGDQSHNPTGLIRVHLKTSLPQLGPSDGVIGTHISSAQYWPLYPTEDPAGLPNTGIGPAWLVNGVWKTLGAMQQIPTVTILDQTPARASFRLRYNIDSVSVLHETVVVEPGGVTVTDSVVGGGINGLRVYYPMLVSDGILNTQIQVGGNTATLNLRGKGAQFSVTRPAGATLVRTNVQRNHRNGRAELVYADLPSRVVEYKVTAWPVYVPASVRMAGNARVLAGPVIGFDGAFLTVEEAGPHRAEIRTLSGRVVWAHEGTGWAHYDLRSVGQGQGVLFLSVRGDHGKTVRKFTR